jgi:hypothetical protein
MHLLKRRTDWSQHCSSSYSSAEEGDDKPPNVLGDLKDVGRLVSQKEIDLLRGSTT